MSADIRFKRFADLVCRYGINVQPGRPVNISCRMPHKEIALLIAERAYELGALHVGVEWLVQEFDALHARKATPEGLRYTPRHVGEQVNQLLDKDGCQIRLAAPDDPRIYEGASPAAINMIGRGKREARRKYYAEAVELCRYPWCVTACPEPSWAARVFPELPPSEQLPALWEVVFRILRLNDDGYLDAWRAQDRLLHERSATLDALEIATLHFSGPGTDLTVALSPAARFSGGSHESRLGTPFSPNLPTEEIFTTPDWRGTTGTVRVTRPIMVNGTLVRGLEMRFENGEAVSFDAKDGRDAFATFLAADAGAKRLGEVALVGIDSPVYQSGLLFQEILLDENACCHIALGNAYRGQLADAATMSAEELQALGCNQSAMHLDMMISSEEVSVAAHTREGTSVPLLEKGAWVL